MSIIKGNHTLYTLEDWATHAPPKAPHQWVDGRSAKEAARAWCGQEGLPDEVSAVLRAHPRFGPVLSWTAEPEAKLPFDTFQGETRNSDLAVHAHDRFGSYLIAVEAKADEPFGETVGKTLIAAKRRLQDNPRSNGIARVEHLVQGLFGTSPSEAENVVDLRYQLLTASAGALCEAQRRGYGRTVMLVHEFVTAKTNDKYHSRNSDDLRHFLNQLLKVPVSELASGNLYGPLNSSGALFNNGVELFVGKVTRNLRAAGTQNIEER